MLAVKLNIYFFFSPQTLFSPKTRIVKSFKSSMAVEFKQY